MDFKSKIILIYGPTASGKSTFSVKLAKRINGEIINADSMQNSPLVNQYIHNSAAQPGNRSLLNSTANNSVSDKMFHKSLRLVSQLDLATTVILLPGPARSLGKIISIR